jgi:hypothetical protein
VIVAHYEVVGKGVKDSSVPAAQGTIETFGFWSCTPLSDCQHWSMVPFLLRHPDYGGQAGTDTSLKNANPVRRGGYWATFVRSLRD